MEFGKTLAKFVLIAAIAGLLLWQLSGSLLGLGHQPLERGLMHAGYMVGWTFLTLGAALILVALVGPAFVPHPEHVTGSVSTGTRFRPPSAQWWFGTNELGQDVFSLVVAGSRISLLAGLAALSGLLLRNMTPAN
jgi:ABC-type dipeptide/oligopeptide/nickel transport system permease subunit